jgi:hypothetical protein
VTGEDGWARFNSHPSLSISRTFQGGPTCAPDGWWRAVPNGPAMAKMEPVIKIEFQRIEALELLAMTLADLKDAETRGEMSPRVPLLMAIRDRLATAVREEEP